MLPNGTVSRTWTNSSTTDNSEKRYRFGGKEIAGSSLTDLAGTGAAAGAPYLDFGARLYSPKTATWLSPDPLMEKYYGISPFVYCAGGPGNMVDLDGMKIWEISPDGTVIHYYDQLEEDIFYIVEKNSDGLYAKQYKLDINNNIVENKISFKQNTILGYYSDEKGQNALFKVTSNEEGNRLFKFLADNSIVEFGVVNTSSGSSYLMTNNDRKSVNITNKAIELDHRGETITAIIPLSSK